MPETILPKVANSGIRERSFSLLSPMTAGMTSPTGPISTPLSPGFDVLKTAGRWPVAQIPVFLSLSISTAVFTRQSHGGSGFLLPLTWSETRYARSTPGIPICCPGRQPRFRLFSCFLFFWYERSVSRSSAVSTLAFIQPVGADFSVEGSFIDSQRLGGFSFVAVA